MKKFKKKKLPIKMKTMKNIICAGLDSYFGPLSVLVISMAWYIMSGQPSNDETMNNVIIACPMSSKLESKRFHSPPWSSQTH